MSMKAGDGAHGKRHAVLFLWMFESFHNKFFKSLKISETSPPATTHTHTNTQKTTPQMGLPEADSTNCQPMDGSELASGYVLSHVVFQNICICSQYLKHSRLSSGFQAFSANLGKVPALGLHPHWVTGCWG